MAKDMSLMGHLEELRLRIIKIVLALIIAASVCYAFFDELLKIILIPLGNQKLVYLTVTEPFIARFKLGFMAALVVCLPIIIYQVLAFLAPGLDRREKKYLFFSVLLIVPLFTCGAVFGYYVVLPVGIKWLLAQSGPHLKQNLTVSNYISFSLLFLLSFGLTFETPVIVWMLSKLNIVTHKTLLRNWRIALVSILFIAAFITPDWSPVTMMLVAAPAFVLYFLGIILARFF
ncbi:MAG: twin-arginine translocase subunit TatC [Actinobacteria bacterium]|nr:MAG: twin-arginine translocase subunit TatC [Actinomycetota bacterium]